MAVAFPCNRIPPQPASGLIGRFSASRFGLVDFQGAGVVSPSAPFFLERAARAEQGARWAAGQEAAFSCDLRRARRQPSCRRVWWPPREPSASAGRGPGRARTWPRSAPASCRRPAAEDRRRADSALADRAARSGHQPACPRACRGSGWRSMVRCSMPRNRVGKPGWSCSRRDCPASDENRRRL